ncbi:MAG TPA: ATP-binding protein [Xanthobacteraceae bacterium]|jgi:signal transduction histidine kinase/CheY-like chemotaxis protein|nr:ATP-binding protein [Xanthobacteraceae bacterium]
MSLPIITLPIENEGDVVAVRQRARRIAELLGFERQDQTRIATAVSEIARNAFGYAGGGRAEFAVELEGPSQSFCIRISDKGKGIPNLQPILDGEYRSPSGMGLGLAGARRLMDRFKIDSVPGQGTVVELEQILPRRAPKITRARLSDITAALKQEGSADPLEVLRDQNRELLQSLEDIRRRDEESKLLNQELGDTNRGVVALYAELDERAEQLRTASELKSRFLSHMSHEFRTPLNSVLALSRLLLDRIDGDLSAEQERQIGYIRRSAESLLELVNDLLDLAKVEAGKVDVKSTRFTVTNLFGGLRGALRPLLLAPSVDLIFDAANDIPELLTDESKVAQILRNLISNALKFTEKGEVSVTAHYQSDKNLVTFAVRDTGIGIAPADQERIFEEFAQVDTRLQRKVKGTGLGLPLSRSLAELIGGRLTVESVTGQGSVFQLTIPATFGEDAELAPAIVPDLSRKRVLIIDDDETFRYVLKQIIRNEPRYEVLEANDGGDGLRLARTEHPDVIVLDLQMPNVDGFTVLQELSADQRTSVIPLIVSTSLSVDAELKARLPAGTRVISKNLISRENVSLFLRDATSFQSLLS